MPPLAQTPSHAQSALYFSFVLCTVGVFLNAMCIKETARVVVFFGLLQGGTTILLLKWLALSCVELGWIFIISAKAFIMEELMEVSSCFILPSCNVLSLCRSASLSCDECYIGMLLALDCSFQMRCRLGLSNFFLFPFLVNRICLALARYSFCIGDCEKSSLFFFHLPMLGTLC